MAHWLLRERMAEHNDDDGRARPERLKEDQFRSDRHRDYQEIASERASEPRERSAPAERRARARVGESEGRTPRII